MAATLLLYNFSDPKVTALKKLCMLHRMRVQLVQPSQFSLTLDQLLQSKGGENAAEVPSFIDEMLVFAGVAPGQLDGFLKGFRKAGLPPVPLKAVLTATNAGWTSVQLHHELILEHEAMSKGQRQHST